ncbi:MAG: cation transporter [Candidatus Omnitrophica bacterium]|nr:cation transporter [Candidatus Omnitrophota bacterium]
MIMPLSEQTNIDKIKRITWLGIVINICLAVFELVLGIIARSQMVVADAIHTLSDLVTDFALVFGVKAWHKPADKEHPYGHRRVESLITFFISASLLIVALWMAYSAVKSIGNPDREPPGIIGFWGAFAAVIIKELLYRWTLKVGKEVNSSAVIAKAWHHRSDSFSSIPVCIAVLTASIMPQWSFIDHIGAFIVSLFILYSGWMLAAPVLAEFLETGASQKEIRKIRDIALNTPGVKDVHKIRSRYMGSSWFVDLHLLVDGRLSVKKGHEISEEVKMNLLQKGNNIADVVIHIEPVDE